MKTLKEQISNRCQYFNGLMNKECEKSVKYEGVREPEAKPYKFPCFRNSMLSGGHCDLVSFPSDEIVNQIVMGIMDEGKKSMMGYSLVVKHIKETGNATGEIGCPACKGKLRYTQSSVNGHIWAHCKCGLGWME